MSILSLGTHIADPAKRLAHVLTATAAMKADMGAMKSLMPSDFPSPGLPWLMASLSSLYEKVRVADRIPAIANLTISNVPDPTVPRFMAGAPMLTNHPTSIVVHGVALNITVQACDESLKLGLIACGQAMPEVAELAHRVEAAFDASQALPASDEVGPVAALAATAIGSKKSALKRTTEALKPSTKSVSKATSPARASVPETARPAR